MWRSWEKVIHGFTTISSTRGAHHMVKCTTSSLMEGVAKT
ncbi:hypothetical protein Pint_09509 [Pistacia integerrima]|uniref:Uncharacterized protein n=1 Tax=Pistacia integerrima TaxID=434235 RepID=A0ACC0XFG0_9ROSI|nr:hypothetical protein Pint_09509 [Pistacia integerrima]